MNIRNILSKFKTLATRSDIDRVSREVMKSQVTTGKFFGEFNHATRLPEMIADIRNAEFQVFSQWGDDGIIYFLTRYLNVHPRTFVEFGVENYSECNTKFLLIHGNWSGLIMDGSESNMQSVKSDNLSWQFDLHAKAAFVTAENINALISSRFRGELGLLHIDIDGNDYWVWKAVDVVNPVIVIVEYNSVFGFDNPWTVPYDAGFLRSKAHHSNLLYGSSLLSLCDLADVKGYHFVGCNSNGNNAYFVRKDKISGLNIKTAKDGFVLSKFAESRDATGNLNFLRSEDRLASLKGQKIFNTRTNQVETII